MRIRQQMIGKTYGFLHVLDVSDESSSTALRLICYCMRCDSIVTADGYKMRAGKAQSCGCMRRAGVGACKRTHGKSHTVEFTIWAAMKRRCNTPSDTSYKNYGARGIRVCHEWRDSFERFLADMGTRPSSKHSLERIDNNGPYCKSNCEWTDRISQNNNRRSSRMLTVNGITRSVAQWERAQGLGTGSIYARLKLGWTHERAVMTPRHHYTGRLASVSQSPVDFHRR